MKKYQIPESLKPGFEILKSLNEENTKIVASVLENMRVGTGPIEFQNQLSKVLIIEQLNLIAATIYSFGSLLFSKTDNDFELIANDLSDSFASQVEPQMSNEEIKSFKIKILSIFSKCSNLKYTFKALNLLSENQKVYQDSRIVTDIRIIFNDDIADSHRKALIIHQLKVEHEIDSELQEFFVSLDSNDLLKLRGQIERSLEKEKQIRNSYPNIAFIDITD